MRKSIFMSVLLAAVCFAMPVVGGTPVQDASYKFITRYDIGRNLVKVGLGIAMAAPAYKEIVKVVGEGEAQSLVLDELKTVRPRYQDPWDRNLADAYAKYFTVDEMNSLAAEGEKSRYARKFVDQTKVVGGDVAGSSTLMLRAFVTEALTNAYARTTMRR